MWFARQCLHCSRQSTFLRATPRDRGLSSIKHETDEYGVPLQPTWSVHKLLSSYPKPTLPSHTLTRLHELSALSAPAERTEEHINLKTEVEELIRLVEAVKLVDTHDVCPTNHIGESTKTSGQVTTSQEEACGRELLRHASRTLEGFYVVDSERKRI